MHEFRNWRWFKKYAGGPISDLGAHQIDVYNWMLESNPQALIASGGVDYYKTHEWYDNAYAIYEYPTKEGIVRATYNVLTTTSAGGGYHEYFMGDEGSLKISESPKNTKLYREARAPEWDQYAAQKLITQPDSGEGAILGLKPWEKPRQKMAMPSKPLVGGSGPAAAAKVDVRETAALSAWDIPVAQDKAIHQYHLENFFDAIRKGTPLNCPAEQGFATAVTVLGVNQAIAAKKELTFKKEDFFV
jgi:predicted dehydrogenase